MNKLFALFFAFGATMCALTLTLLLIPGTPLDSLWRLNPEARPAFQSLGKVAALLMFVVGVACAFAAAGMWRGSLWGTRLAVIILSINILGDLFNALVRHDLRTLIGLPIGGAMILYLLRAKRPHIQVKIPSDHKQGTDPNGVKIRPI
jgi:uncharacterized membrane protein (DUF2068 family)